MFLSHVHWFSSVFHFFLWKHNGLISLRLNVVVALIHATKTHDIPLISFVFIFSIVFWNLEISASFGHSDIDTYRKILVVAMVGIQKWVCTSLTFNFLRQVGFALARTCRHLTPPELNAAVHGVCAGPDSCTRGEPRALRIGRLRVPDPGECGGGPDQPAEQGLGVGAPCCPSPPFLPSLHWCPRWRPHHPLQVTSG